MTAGELQDGLDVVPPGGTFFIPEGVYDEQLTVRSDVTIVGAGPGKSILEHHLGGGSAIRITPDAALTLEAVGMRSPGPEQDVWVGIQNEGAQPLSVLNCVLDGGPIASGYAAIRTKGALTIGGSVLANWFGGGAIVCKSLTMDHCVVSNVMQGDLAIQGVISASGASNIRSSLIISNHCNAYGTVVLMADAEPCRIDGTAIVGNTCTADEEPAGLVNYGDLVVTGSLIAQNRSGGAGAFINHAIADVLDTTVAFNESHEIQRASVGGIENQGSMSLTFVTVVGNEVGNGSSQPDRICAGGVCNRGDLYMAGCLVAWNRNYVFDQASDFPGQDVFGPIRSRGFNLITDTNGCALTGDLTGNLIGVDPKIDALRDNGGPTPTMALLPGSPAIDAGDPSLVTWFDQRGLPRSQDGDGDGHGRPDIGAYERLARPTPVLFPVTSEDPSTFSGLLVGDPGAKYHIQEKGDVEGLDWKDLVEVQADAGGFARFGTGLEPAQQARLFRAVKE